MKTSAFLLGAILALTACTSEPPASAVVEPRIVDVPSIAGGSVMQLTIDDQSGRLTEVRAAAVDEVEQAGGLVGDLHIASTPLPGHAGSVLVRWTAWGCDTSGRLTISAQAKAITVAPGPIGSCDAVGDMRGVVLGFDPPVEPAALRLDLLPTPIIDAAASDRPTPAAPSPTTSLAPTPTPTPEPLAVALARHNTNLVHAEAGSAPVIGDDTALAAARELYTLGTPTVSLGRLTVKDWHLGDENAPLAVEDRLVYVVQLTGLTMYPSEGSEVHHELVVFIDAVTGEFVLATTVR